MLRRHWRFIIPVAVQLVILLLIPARQIRTLSTGETVRLKVTPYAPDWKLRGYSLHLTFDISNPEELLKEQEFKRVDRVYVILERGEEGLWKAVGIEGTEPTELPAGRLFIRGWMGWRRWPGLWTGRRSLWGSSTPVIPATRTTS